MIDRAVYSAANCSLARTLALIGEKWTLLILREAFNGADRFEQFHQVLGCARNLLAARLELLVEYGIFERAAYKEPRSRTRHRYVLTAKGAELIAGLIALTEWGDRHLADPGGPPAVVGHRDCGGAVSVVMRCDHDHEPVSPDQVDLMPGPGAIRPPADPVPATRG